MRLIVKTMNIEHGCMCVWGCSLVNRVLFVKNFSGNSNKQHLFIVQFRGFVKWIFHKINDKKDQATHFQQYLHWLLLIREQTHKQKELPYGFICCNLWTNFQPNFCEMKGEKPQLTTDTLEWWTPKRKKSKSKERKRNEKNLNVF